MSALGKLVKTIQVSNLTHTEIKCTEQQTMWIWIGNAWLINFLGLFFFDRRYEYIEKENSTK